MTQTTTAPTHSAFPAPAPSISTETTRTNQSCIWCKCIKNWAAQTWTSMNEVAISSSRSNLRLKRTRALQVRCSNSSNRTHKLPRVLTGSLRAQAPKLAIKGTKSWAFLQLSLNWASTMRNQREELRPITSTSDWGSTKGAKERLAYRRLCSKTSLKAQVNIK